MHLNQTIKLSDNVFAQLVDDEMVLLDMASENYFGLDETGSAIWQQLSKTGSLQATYDALIEEYEIQPAQLEADIFAFVQTLVDAGLVEV
uniref:PqqD family protein n=1 Tax=Sulfurovum sp. TaxID=1969726 RepID=UPI003565FC57